MTDQQLRRFIDVGMDLVAKWRERDPEAVLYYFRAVERVHSGEKP